MTQKELDEKYRQLIDSDEYEENPDSVMLQWIQYLEDSGLVEWHHVECNWGEYGVLPFIDSLIEYINEGRKLEIFTNPDCEGGGHWGYLVFNKGD